MTTSGQRLWVGAAALLLLAACGGGSETAQEHLVRGEVVQVPRPDDPAGELHIRHEAIDGWIDSGGNAVGMSSMTMPFPVGDGVALDGIAAGDIVEFDLRIDWQAERDRLAITGLRELPAGTKLEFREARPPSYQN